MNRDNRMELTREEKMNEIRAKRRRRRSHAGLFVSMLSLLVSLVILMYGGLMVYSELKEQRDAQNTADMEELQESQESSPVISDAVGYSQEELDRKIAEAVAQAQNAEAERVLDGIKTALSEGTTTVETLRPYYPNELVVVSGGRFHFLPISDTLVHNQYDVANLNILETGEFQYMTDGQVTSHKGIDVSSHQGDIDWNLVAQDGVEFAFIRAIYRGYGTGKLVEDEKFEAWNIQGANAAGVKAGVYVFSQAITEEELQEEANMVLEKIAPYQIDCPVVFDVEKVSGNGRMNALSVEERTRLTKLFCDTIANAGYKPMIYHNTEMGALMLNLEELEGYEKWYASYSDKMFYPYEYKIWQYSDKGRVQGIDSAVDMNISFAPFWE